MANTFTENDVRLLDKTIRLREQIIDAIDKVGLPTRDKELSSFTNLLESVDRSIFSRAKIHIEDSNAKTNEATKEVLKDLLLSLHSNTPSETSAVDRAVPVFQTTNMPITEGETIMLSDNYVPTANN